MKISLLSVSALALVSTFAACGTQQQPANNVTAQDDMNMMMADSGPFGDVEMRMNDAMMSAVGVNAGDTWVRKMIQHHKGAVEMSRLVLTLDPGAHVAGMANSIIGKQTREIAALDKLVTQGNPDPASAELYQPAMDQMHRAMMAVTGADLSETFHRKMLEHHKGAVGMSDVALANGVTGSVRAQVEKTRADQQKEVDMVEAMLRGEPGSAASEPIPSTTAAKPDAPKPAPAKPTPAKPKAPDPAPDPHAGHDMNNMQ